ncbi:MAG: hypothetical protein OJF59_001840 [Cytophagales bacterium]|jgi:hypothetical protein|nr:MAG: hypothetical protein OJF59_001840 [Cytophagales bacterium]
MKLVIYKSLSWNDLIRIKTGLSVLARCTFVYTNVISLLPPCSRQEGVASELGSLQIKDF